ncbi:MAG: GAP family protein, partial [Thermomicrobiales bacterium]
FSAISPPVAFGLSTGSLIISGKQWVFTLAALGIIREGELARPQAIAAYLIYVAAAQALLLLPLLGMLVARQRTAALLDSAMAWLQAHERAIVVTISLVFGVLFLSRGITGLR